MESGSEAGHMEGGRYLVYACVRSYYFMYVAECCGVAGWNWYGRSPLLETLLELIVGDGRLKGDVCVLGSRKPEGLRPTSG